MWCHDNEIIEWVTSFVPAGGHAVVAPHLHKFCGIRNGIDPELWDPENNQWLPQPITAETVAEVCCCCCCCCCCMYLQPFHLTDRCVCVCVCVRACAREGRDVCALWMPACKPCRRVVTHMRCGQALSPLLAPSTCGAAQAPEPHLTYNLTQTCTHTRTHTPYSDIWNIAAHTVR